MERQVIKRLDRLVGRGRFASRGQVIAAVVTETLRQGKERLSVADVAAMVRRGRAEHRAGKTRIIGSSAELR